MNCNDDASDPPATGFNIVALVVRAEKMITMLLMMMMNGRATNVKALDDDRHVENTPYSSCVREYITTKR